MFHQNPTWKLKEIFQYDCHVVIPTHYTIRNFYQMGGEGVLVNMLRTIDIMNLNIKIRTIVPNGAPLSIVLWTIGENAPRRIRQNSPHLHPTAKIMENLKITPGHLQAK